MKAKILSIIEVSFVFILMIGLFRLVQSIPLAMQITNSFNGFLFPGYAALLVASFCLTIFRTHHQTHSPFSRKLKYQFIIAAYGFFPIFVLGVLLSWIDWRQWVGAAVISIIEIGLLFWLAWMVKNKPSWENIGVICGLLLFPVASLISTKLVNVIVAIIYFYLFVALGEETLFRGYIQSRLNSAFGRPKHFLGVSWGWGLIISSVLFGLWHLGWIPGTLEWPHVMWTIFAGLIFGFVREKSEGVIAPALLHGIMNYGPQAILFYIFWSK
jgi:membrane protease YdiL (CAAX protease family)